MKTLLPLVFGLFTAPAVFSQKLSNRPVTLVPYVAPKLDSSTIAAMQRDIWSYKGPKSKTTLRIQELPVGDKMPNGFTADQPLLVYKGNSIYESTIDHMPILIPEIVSNMPVKGKTNQK